ncbi:MAG: NAD(P) transhydrogenase subunit alpha [Holosporales bacterium]|jgi:NAD(P) transhydrogenase subunit alpha|nr:NAD(P) transhydrogenase subunit alpha [Holosporales bacterium]
MNIGVVKESVGESRVAMTPDVTKKLSAYSLLVETQAGCAAGYPDGVFEPVAEVVTKRQSLVERAHILVAINLPDDDTIRCMKPGTILIGQLSPSKNIESIKLLARMGVSAFSLDLLPRTTQAQSMDILSSQSNLAGYQAVICAASMLGRAFPMMTTAAGNVPPVRVLVIGAGVAGLQAIATAKRLGCVVSAFDVRSATREQVESLGATFISVASHESGEGGGGYAKEMSDAYKANQEARLMEVMPRQDVVITTAQIPNKPAPKIITKEMVASMRSGGLVVDLAGASGGNCELAVPGECVQCGEQRVWAPLNIINGVANTASFLFASNVAAFVRTLIRSDGTAAAAAAAGVGTGAAAAGAGTAAGAPLFDVGDELVRRTLVAHDGAVCPLL